MNKVIITLCLAVVLWFASQQWLTEAGDGLSHQTPDTTTSLHAFSRLEVGVLEQTWQQALAAQKKQQELAAQEQAKPTAKQNKNLISIGNHSFELIGVFKQQAESFVLLKPESGALIKSGVNQVVIDEIKVTSISANSVVLSSADQSKEFKLFKWHKNEQVN
ncbi:hypothetical protein [Pseudoalteromonas sp. PS5]|uniref:hypothetical protein n=1 Tax=Pseudoalteromonas sp. PS5 TaxID=1437473 RepID=UPI000FFF38AD|nr:hypothetical protein [Pseudoalteromonas sp. PS5]RXF02886.1 hypothetical protein D9603_09320 [Pseudoalteromonas sp. PS5]